MDASPIRMVVFDLGGVVVRICRTWQEACAAAGVCFKPEMTAAELIAARKPVRHAYERGEMSDEAYFAALAEASGRHYRPDEIRAMHESWILSEYPGVAGLLDGLHQLGLHTGVLSNTNASHWRQLVSGPHGAAKFPTVEKARHVHASHLLGLIKPHKAIYDKFCAVTGFGPEEIVFFDDMPENVQGAIDAGWDAVPIDHTGDTASQMRMHLRMRGIDV